MPITQRTRKILWTRAANRCAMCRAKLTVEPAHARDRTTVLGIECHIVARKPGGARSNEIPPLAIDDYSNLILLCPSDHALVDAQPAEYSSERLLDIKRSHEHWVNEALEWRAALTEDLWERVKQEAHDLLMVVQEDQQPEGAFQLIERLGVYSHITAEFLLAPELLLFVRASGGEVALAYKYERGAILFAHSDGNFFPAGFAAFASAPTVEDHTKKILEQAAPTDDRPPDESGIARFYSVAESLAEVAKRTGIDEAVVYVRDGHLPELSVRYTHNKIELAAGPSGTFPGAYRSFAQGSPQDISQGIRLTMFTDKLRFAVSHESDRGFGALVSNLVVLSVRKGIKDSFPAAAVSIEQLLEVIRDRCFEGMLMLRVMREIPDDPRVQEWATKHADPEPQDGLSAVLPIASLDAVRAFADENDSHVDEDDLSEKVLDGTYEAIGLVFDSLRSIDQDIGEDEVLVASVIELAEWWDEPVASPEILELAHAAGIENRD